MKIVPQNLAEALAEAQILFDQGRIASQMAAFGSILKENPDYAPLIHYQMGATQQAVIGDGAQARSLFLQVLEELKSAPADFAHRQELERNSIENMLLLSLNYAEFEGWAESLKNLGISNALEMGEKIRINRESDTPWYQVMHSLSINYGQKTVGRYGYAACILDLLIQHRKVQRIPRDDFGEILLKYAACKVQMATAYAMTMQRSLGYTDPAEFNFIAEQVPPVLQAYLGEHPDEPKIVDMLAHVNQFLNIPPQGKKPASPSPMFVSDARGGFSSAPASPVPASPASSMPLKKYCLGWLLYGIGLIGGGVLGWSLSAHKSWGYLAGGALGFVIMFFLMAIFDYLRKKRSGK